MGAGGRPTKYNSDFCQKAIQMGREGDSITSIASQLGVCKQTVYTWMKNHPEFLDAIKESVTHAQKWWEDQGKKSLFMDSDKKFCSAVWQKTMASRFKEDYGDETVTRVIEVESEKDTPVKESKIDEIVRQTLDDFEKEY